MQIKNLYREHDIDSCMQLIPSAKQQCRNINFQLANMTQAEQDQIMKLMENIESQHREMLTFVRYLEPDGWEDQG